MKPLNSIPFAAPSKPPLPGARNLGYLTGFESVAPRYRTRQTELLDWLAEAHVRAGAGDRATMAALLERYSASAEQIAVRGHELEDFTHRDWDRMCLFGPGGSDLAQKTRFFEERANAIFETLYPPDATPPKSIVHVTCTGYSSPSGAQRLVSTRGWGQHTEVVHAYHMGCYAAHPAVRYAAGLGGADVVHTELCSLHLNPAQHDPSHLVIQSLFADGFIRYRLESDASDRPGLEILAARDEIVPDSTGAMAWSTGPFHFTMELSKEVPVLLASALPRFVARLFEEAGLDWAAEKTRVVAAVHPGGPRIIELSQRILGLEPAQVRWSHEVLRDHGNMSSATLPHIWQQILADQLISNGSLIVSLGAGPGLTLSGMLFRKKR
jgi:predicted naringenin-chalcone synthase